MASDTEGAVGLTQILAETGQNLLGMRVDVAAQPPLHAPDPARACCAAGCSRSQRLQRRPPQGRPALRPRPGAGRHRALPQAGQGALPPRRHGLRLLPHGHGQPRERPARLRGEPATRTSPTRRSTSTPRPSRNARRLREARLVRRRLLQLPVEARRRARDHAPVAARTRASSPASQAAQTAKASAEEVLHPPGSTPRFADARDSCSRRGTTRTSSPFPRQPARDRPARATRAWASWRGGWARRRALLRGPAPGGARHRALHRRRGARALRPGAADRHLDRARRRLPAPARAPATARRPATTRCTPPAGRSTSPAATAPSARRSRSSSCSTACRRSTRSPGCASPARSTSPPRRRGRPCSRCSSEYNPPG